MPKYEFYCPNGHTYDVFSSISRRDEPRACPECGETGAREEIPVQGSRIDTGGGYEMAAISKKTGQKIPGNFGRYAPTKKGGKWR
jgi:putative FmdB family regulatory protein